MDTSDPKDAIGQTPRRERAERSETLFGYSRTSEDLPDSEVVDADISALE
jgi:hypothetical protein